LNLGKRNWPQMNANERYSWTVMRLANAIKRIHGIPDGWVCVEQVHSIRGGLELCFGIRRGRRGNTIATWVVHCFGVHEAKVTDLDGGGIALYASDHPAARQYTTPWSELRWPRETNQKAVLGTLYDAHINAVEDWVPFERYVLPNSPYQRGF